MDIGFEIDVHLSLSFRKESPLWRYVKWQEVIHMHFLGEIIGYDI